MKDVEYYPVDAWQIHDFADGWITTDDKKLVDDAVANGVLKFKNSDPG